VWGALGKSNQSPWGGEPKAGAEQRLGWVLVQFVIMGEEYGFYFCLVFAMFGVLYFRPFYYRELQTAYLRFCKLGQHLL